MADEQAPAPEAKEKKEPKKLPPKLLTAKKRNLQNEKRRQINKSFKSKVRSSMRSMEEGLKNRDKVATEKAASEIYSLMDKGVKRKLFKKNKADRTKARTTARLLALAG